MNSSAHPIPSSAAASHHAATSPSLELLEARQARDGLAALLRREHVAMAEFLVALADFDHRRGWERLGHASLFAFLHVELKLPNPSAYWRMSAARLLQRFPEVVEPLCEGRLCCTATAELAKVLTEENRAEVLPRFFGLSLREAQEVVAELQPRQAPPTRTVVTAPVRAAAVPSLAFAEASASREEPQAMVRHPDVVPPTQLRAPEAGRAEAAPATPPRDLVEPLTGQLRRLHMTVSKQFLRKLDAARDSLSHAIPGATAEQVLEAALDLLLEKRAKARGLVKKPRTAVPAAAPTATSTTTSTPIATSTPASSALSAEPLHRRADPREHIPAAIRRAVWTRDQWRCSWPLDGGGTCGSTYQLELDHKLPWARWGGETVDDLRVVCHHHNSLAARQAFGERFMSRYRRTDGGAAP